MASKTVWVDILGSTARANKFLFFCIVIRSIFCSVWIWTIFVLNNRRFCLSTWDSDYNWSWYWKRRIWYWLKMCWWNCFLVWFDSCLGGFWVKGVRLNPGYIRYTLLKRKIVRYIRYTFCKRKVVRYIQYTFSCCKVNIIFLCTV